MKTYQQFISEATTKSDKLLGRLKMLYNLPSDKEKYYKQQNPPEFDRLKKAQGNALTPQVAQLAPLEKENQLPGKYSDVFIRTVDSSMDKLKDRVKRYGNLQRLKDIDSRYP